MPPEEVVALSRQVGDALEHAHRQGVIHRDIKPENILLSDGHAIVADFGIAKAVTAASDRSITRTGFPVGTVGYMSPEQAAGFAELNERSDVFSLTGVIYEMLVGQVAGIVARAAELDALPTQSGNLSLGGIQQLAADVGIPPQHVERAAPPGSWLTVRPLAWRTVGTQHQPSRVVSVSISPAGGRTRILIDESLTPTAGGIFGGLMGGLGGGRLHGVWAEHGGVSRATDWLS